MEKNQLSVTVKPIPAATALFVRDGCDGLEVLMIERNEKIDFASGALVFPGGKVGETDFDVRIKARCQDAQGLSDFECAVRIACIREAFEECGILLARKSHEEEILCDEQLGAMTDLRMAVECGDISFYDVIVQNDLILLPKLLVPYAHWVTPVGLPKRFDTYFFIAKAPRQHVSHCTRESVNAHWYSPQTVLQEVQAKKRKLVFPTRLNVGKLKGICTVRDALYRFSLSEPVTVCPTIEHEDGSVFLRIPHSAGYDETVEQIG